MQVNCIVLVNSKFWVREREVVLLFSLSISKKKSSYCDRLSCLVNNIVTLQTNLQTNCCLTNKQLPSIETVALQTNCCLPKKQLPSIETVALQTNSCLPKKQKLLSYKQTVALQTVIRASNKQLPCKQTFTSLTKIALQTVVLQINREI